MKHRMLGAMKLRKTFLMFLSSSQFCRSGYPLVS
jgi:hypothetical protein